MLGKQSQQTSILDIESWFGYPIVKPDSFYGLMSTWGSRLIKDEDFTELYSHTGRPSVSPALLSKVLLLMYKENVTDREAEDRAKYDLRWKVALQLPMNESGFDYTALCRFRARLIANEKEKMIFEKFVRLAKEAGLVKENSAQIIDSTRVLGAAAVQNTFELIKGGIQKLLKVCQKQDSKAKQILKDLSLSLDYSKKDKEDIDWTDAKSRQELLNKLVTDSKNIIAKLQDVDLETPEKKALEILQKVTDQDIQETDENQVELKDGVSKDRIISINDSEMRHGHKSSTGKFNGYKAQVMIDKQTELITNIGITPGNRPDAECLNEMLETTIVKPDQLIGDTAYGTMAARDILEKHNVKPVAPMPPGTKKKDKFSKYDFKIDFGKATCECPGGQISTQTRKNKGHIISFKFSKQVCNKCPLRDQCTTHDKGRLVSLQKDEPRRRSINDFNQTAEFKMLYSSRPTVERAICHLIQAGSRKARYFGEAKNLLQLSFSAVNVNFKKVTNAIKGVVCPNATIEKLLGNA